MSYVLTSKYTVLTYWGLKILGQLAIIFLWMSLLSISWVGTEMIMDTTISFYQMVHNKLHLYIFLGQSIIIHGHACCVSRVSYKPIKHSLLNILCPPYASFSFLTSNYNIDAWSSRGHVTSPDHRQLKVYLFTLIYLLNDSFGGLSHCPKKHEEW